jgi:UPF0755 protein
MPARRRRSGRGGGVLGGVIVIGVLAAVVLGGAYVLSGPFFQDFARGLARDNPQALRIPFVADVIRADLGEDLTEPVSADGAPVEFAVPEGATVSRIGQDLEEAGLLRDRLAFQFLIVTQEVEDKLQNGVFTLNASMTPQQIVDRLQRPPDPPPARVTIAIRDGLRIEQVTAQLAAERPAAIDAAAFYELASQPPAELRQEYAWMSVIPEGRSLEGFLGAGVFEMDAETDAPGFLRVLLDDWERTVGPPYIQQAEEAGYDFYERMIMASIVEKEVTVDAERRQVAGVYQNRLNGELNGNELLNADPTVIYANDTVQLRQLDVAEWTGFSFWGLIGVPSLNDFAVPEDLQSFQTYQTQGLPDWPIASPSLPSIQASIDPDTESGFLFFVACGEGTHRFAATIGEHNENVAECRG